MSGDPTKDEDSDTSGGVEATRRRSAELFAALRDDSAPESTRDEAREGLVHLHLPLVEHCARRFRNRGEPFEDLVQVGTIGLLKSIDRFDLDRGVEFSTYATPTIIGEIKRYFRDKGWAIRVPRRLQELRMQIGATSAELTQSLGRSPTARELAERIGCSVEEILEGIESSNAYSTLSLDASDGDDDGAGTMLDAIGVDDENLEHVEIRESIKPLLDRLGAREKRILLLRFFKNMTQSQIAEEIGVSQMHVSRLLSRTLEQLRTSLEEEPRGRPLTTLVGGQRLVEAGCSTPTSAASETSRITTATRVVSPPQKLNESSTPISSTATTGPRAQEPTRNSPQAQKSSPAPRTRKNSPVVMPQGEPPGVQRDHLEHGEDTQQQPLQPHQHRGPHQRGGRGRAGVLGHPGSLGSALRPDSPIPWPGRPVIHETRDPLV